LDCRRHGAQASIFLRPRRAPLVRRRARAQHVPMHADMVRRHGASRRRSARVLPLVLCRERGKAQHRRDPLRNRLTQQPAGGRSPIAQLQRRGPRGRKDPRNAPLLPAAPRIRVRSGQAPTPESCGAPPRPHAARGTHCAVVARPARASARCAPIVTPRSCAPPRRARVARRSSHRGRARHGRGARRRPQPHTGCGVVTRVTLTSAATNEIPAAMSSATFDPLAG